MGFSIPCELSPMEKKLHDASVPFFLRDGDFIRVSPAEPAQRVVKVNYHCILLTSVCGYICFFKAKVYCMSQASSVDPDQAPQFAVVSDLGLLCLIRS